MQTITDEYRKLNETLHNLNKNYGTSGHLYADEVLSLSQKVGTKDILDYGCGKCTLADTLPFFINKYDPCIRAFSEEPEPADLVTCTDVLEHIEPELLDNVLAHMKEKTKRVVYLAISTRLANKTLADGRNAHLIVQQGDFWFNKISEYFHILSYLKRGDVVIIIANRAEVMKPEVQIEKEISVDAILSERGLA